MWSLNIYSGTFLNIRAGRLCSLFFVINKNMWSWSFSPERNLVARESLMVHRELFSKLSYELRMCLMYF